MSREIKFEFLYQGIPYSSGNSLKPWIKKQYTLEQLCDKSLSQLSDVHSFSTLVAKRQFTGLHDINGVEIYEGDIVSVIDTDYEDEKGLQDYYDGSRESRPTKEVCRDVVTMERFPTYWLRNENFGYEGESLVSPSDCKVIGNIHQNPELLEQN